MVIALCSLLRTTASSRIPRGITTSKPIRGGSTTLRGQRHEMEAYEAEGEERQRLWELDVSVYPPRNHYARRAGNRRIPVMVLQPASTRTGEGAG